MDTELIKRYTYAVTQRLPEGQRLDIEKELSGLIEDMLEERLEGREATRKDVEAVLIELGDPAVLADKYRGHPRYLIGPEIFPAYMRILKIVFFAVGVSMLVVFAIQSIINPPEILQFFVQMIVTSIMTAAQAFGWVTGVFALIEWSGAQKAAIQNEMAKDWSPADLPEVPDENLRISPAEPIIGIILLVLFLVFVTFSIDMLGVWIRQDGGPMQVIPFFNETVFRSFLPFIWGVTGLRIIHEIIRLITGKQTMALLVFEGLINVLGFVLAFFMFSGPAIWNAGFMQQFTASGMLAAGSDAFRTLNEIWTRTTSGLIYLIGVVTIFELISLVVKALKLKNPAWKHRFARLTTID
jgi:hypothetical protein